ncbi:MAG: hypothetical protein AMXMBFR47_00120 [Planctomycetota bacterium]
MTSRAPIGLLAGSLALAAVLSAGCENYPFLENGGRSTGKGADAVAGDTIQSTGGFSEVLIQGRTFIDGSSAATTTYGVGDLTRTPVGIDFNRDGKIDPVAGYGPANLGGVVQILLSKGAPGSVDFSYLSLDGNGRWTRLSDVAAGDMDGDGAPDIIAAASDGVIYLHNPGAGNETTLRDWGAVDPDAEFLAGSTAILTNDEIEAILSDVLPAGTNLDDYDVSVEQGYTRVIIADMDGDGANDVVASRRLKINLEPKDNANVPPLAVIAGELQIFKNPAVGATDGTGYQLITVGRHERYIELDRQGASSVMAYDMDRDGDLDIVSAARDDVNAQLAWFENPGRVEFSATDQWTQWRVGSLRDIAGFDIADFTGDGRADVIATGAAQQQMVLFEQPAEGPRREYDWDSSVIVTFESFQPLDVRALDIDSDGALEAVVGGTLGAIRYFEPGADPRKAWTGAKVIDLAPGDVGTLGFGDLDADGDLDLVVVVNDTATEAENADRIVWIRNDMR